MHNPSHYGIAHYLHIVVPSRYGLSPDEEEALADYLLRRTLLDIAGSEFGALEVATRKFGVPLATPNALFSVGCLDLYLTFKMKVRDFSLLLQSLESGCGPEEIPSGAG